MQHAMNLNLRDEAAFFAEYQNQPLVAEVTQAVIARRRTVTRTPAEWQALARGEQVPAPRQ